MSAAISMDMILTRASTRADGSLGLGFSTPELQPTEKTAMFELLNKELRCVLQPKDDPTSKLVEVAGVLGMKSPSRRLRDCLYRLWQQQNPFDTPFDLFYVQTLDRYCERVKSQLNPD